MTVAYIHKRLFCIKKGYLATIKLILFLGFILLSTQSCVPRCTKFPVYAQCKVRMRHLHSGKEYRGVPIHKKQHMQYGEKYKGAKKDAYSSIKTPKSKRRLVKKKKNITTKPKKAKKKKRSGPVLKPFSQKRN